MIKKFLNRKVFASITASVLLCAGFAFASDRENQAYFKPSGDAIITTWLNKIGTVANPLAEVNTDKLIVNNEIDVATAIVGVGGINMNGEVLNLDVDTDTSITADTDDQIDIEISGADDFQMTANMFTLLDGSDLTMAGGQFDLDDVVSAGSENMIDIQAESNTTGDVIATKTTSIGTTGQTVGDLVGIYGRAKTTGTVTTGDSKTLAGGLSWLDLSDSMTFGSSNVLASHRFAFENLDTSIPAQSAILYANLWDTATGANLPAGLWIENDATTANLAIGAGLYLKSVDSSAGFTYGLDFNDATIDTADFRLENGVTIANSSAGTLTTAGTGGTNNEDLTYDYETVADTVGVSSASGVTDMTWTGINLNTSGNVTGATYNATADTNQIVLDSDDGSGFTTTLTDSATDARVITFPDATGTVGLLSTVAPIDATYITQTADATLTNEQALGALATGLVKNTTTTGVLSIGVADTDYQQPITWGDGLEYSAPTASVDYNTTNLKITSNEIDTIQGISTSASPQFTAQSIGLSGGSSGVLTWIASDNDQVTATINTSDNLAFAGATGEYTFDNNIGATGTIYVNDASGGAILNESATTTNPTLVPNRAENDTGIGWGSDVLHLVLGGASEYNFSTSSADFGSNDLIAKYFVLDPTPDTDDTGQGLKASVTVDTNATGVGACLYMASDGHYDEANAGASATMPCRVIALETSTGTKNILHQGYIRNDDWNWATIGGDVYMDTTDGDLTQTAPSGSGEVLQYVGYATSADEIYFAPNFLTITID